MGLTNMSKNRPIIITGKSGTGKTTKALTLLQEPLIYYASDIEIQDLGSFPVENGILIEDLHYQPDKNMVLHLIRNYQGQIVLTSINQKSIPKEIKAMCQIKRAGATNYQREIIKELAPHSENPISYERDTFSLVGEYIKEKDRDLMANLLKFNRPSDTQILSWLVENMHPNRLMFVDGVVKRRWSQEYFYEMLAYAHGGSNYSRVSMPQRRAYSQIPRLCRRLGVRDERTLKQLLKDSEFTKWAKTKLNNGECRLLKIGEKKTRKPKPILKGTHTNLSDYYD